MAITDVEPEVQAIVAKYERVKAINPILLGAFTDKGRKSIFYQAIKREIRLLKSRSQNLNDRQLNAFQKAFLVLVGHDENSISPAALELFLFEILGLSENDSREDMERDIRGFARLRKGERKDTGRASARKRGGSLTDTQI
jgi:hypothetical protein